jgi:hypothetical protein
MVGRFSKQKTRDWLAIAGFLENVFCGLELSSHVASGNADASALPNGHLSVGSRHVQIAFKRGVHVLTTAMKHHRKASVKIPL